MLDGTITEEDAVHQKFPATMVRETVMVLEMEEQMMEMQDVRRDWFVDQIIVRSLASTTMRRMTAVIYLEILSQSQNQSFQVSLQGFP